MLPRELRTILANGGVLAISCVEFILDRIPITEEHLEHLMYEASKFGEEELQAQDRRLRYAGCTPGLEDVMPYSPTEWAPVELIEIDDNGECGEISPASPQFSPVGTQYDPASPTPPTPDPELIGLENKIHSVTPPSRPSSQLDMANEDYKTAPSPNPTFPPTPTPTPTPALTPTLCITLDDDDFVSDRRSITPPCVYSDVMNSVVVAFSNVRNELENLNSPAAIAAVDALSTLILRNVDLSVKTKKQEKAKARRVLRAKRKFYQKKRDGMFATLLRSVANKDITVREIHERLVQMTIKSDIVDLTSEQMF